MRRSKDPWRRVVIPRSVRELVDKAKAALVAVPEPADTATYADIYAYRVKLTRLQHNLMTELDVLWRDELFDELVNIRPPFDEIYCIDMAQRAVRYPYHEFAVLFNARDNAMNRRMNERSLTDADLPIQNTGSRKRYIVDVCPVDAYRTMGMSSCRYRTEHVDQTAADLVAVGLTSKRITVETDFAGKYPGYGKGTWLVISTAEPWSIDLALRRSLLRRDNAMRAINPDWPATRNKLWLPRRA